MLHHNYQLKIGDLNGRHTRTLVAHDEEEIVGFIPRIPRGEWIKELARKKVSVTDFSSANPEIEVLVGNDYEGMLMTGRIESLECGVTAIQYVWGWALSGRRPEGRYSLASRNIRLIAWMLRFVARCRRAKTGSGNLTQEELWNAEKVVTRMIQSETFGEERWKNKAHLKIKRSADGLLVVETKRAFTPRTWGDSVSHGKIEGKVLDNSVTSGHPEDCK
ncbi:hypothetical protein Fcan01_22652 [Folsomia candida]|uniref:Uncharacterized protein n=1 Tax=Folsomia candida TaxID=158441 RepID=A0A226DCF0_FOLCA|nr:hypothetical protein Fcan01_22652 [Folsomia candida]